jgi:2-phospho-L-lactate guanylyltransferase
MDVVSTLGGVARRPSKPASAGVVLAVKPLHQAKTRLDLSAEMRRALMTTLAAQTVNVAMACPLVDSVVMVTSDREVTAMAKRLGATPVDEEEPAGLNAAFDRGRVWVRNRTSCSVVVLMVADLAWPRSVDLGNLIQRFLERQEPLLVPDRSGSGTTCLMHDVTTSPSLAFGLDSAARHRRLGYASAGPGLASLRHDVDLVEDLDGLPRSHRRALGLELAAVGGRA